MSQLQADKDVDYEQDLHELPAGWSWIALGDICDAINGRAFKSTEWRESGVPIIRIQNLKDPGAAFNYFQGELDDKHKVDAGDLLFAWSGTPGTSFGAHIWNGPNAALNQHIFNVRFDRKHLDTKYLCYALNQNVSRYVAQAQGGVGLAHITKSKFIASKLPIAPLDQQKRIVAEIEKQFSRLDEAVGNLKRVKANLKRYKAAVLKAAVEGRLVEREAELARQQNRQYETGEQLLQRILETRRSQWQGKGKYKEPAAPDTTDLPELPEGWVWASVEQISNLVTDGDHNPPKRAESGIPHLTAKNIREWRIDPTGCTYISREDSVRVFKRYLPKANDLIVTCVGTVGRTAIIPEGYEFSPDRNLAAIRLAMTMPDVNYLQIVLESPGYQKRMRGASGATAQPHLYLSDLRALSISLPPLVEQRRIVAEVDRRLTIFRETEAQVDANLQRAESLRQAILSKAFQIK